MIGPAQTGLAVQMARQGVNLYYCAWNNPVTNSDPSGLWPGCQTPPTDIPLVPCPANIKIARDALCSALKRLEVKPETLFSERAVFSEASDRRAKTIAYRRAFEGQ